MRRVAVVGLALTALLVLPPAAGPGDAASCPPAGGTPHPFTTDDTIADDPDVVINGGGFGHGVGMSQYGAQGAAKLGCSHEQILSTYYPTTALEDRTSRDVVRIKMRTAALDPTRVRTTAEQFGGRPLDWVACDVYGEDCATVATQPAGTTWTVVPHGEDRGWNLELLDGDGASVWHGGDQGTRLRLMHDGTVVRVLEAVPSGSHDPAGMRVKWGWVEFDHSAAHGGLTYVTSYVTAGASGMSAIDTYLRGLAEVPASWEAEAQQAQAVAARSYAEAQMAVRDQVYDRVKPCGECAPSDVPNRGTLCRCDLVPTTADQFWNGFDKEAGSGFSNWRDAIAATTNQYVVSEGEVAATFYSSSHGDSSAASKDIWSADLPYLQAVDTSRWEDATRSSNSLMRWTRGFDSAWLASRFELDEVRSIEVVEREPGGRPAHDGVVVTGVVDGEQVQRRYGSEGIRTRLRMPSGLIRVEDGTVAPPETEEPPEEGEEPAEPPEARRLAGSDRIGTAVAVSRDGWDAAETVVIARADAPPDALAGSGLAGSLDAPLLVTWTDRLAAPVATEIDRLGAERAILLGGESALSSDVESDLSGRGVAVERVAGRTRAGTAAAIAERLSPAPGGTALIVRGRFPQHPQRAWADALAVSGLTARRAAIGDPWPVLLANDELTAETRQSLADLDIADVGVIGGEATLPDEVVIELQELGLAVRRVSGVDRYGTSRAVASLDTGTAPLLIAATGGDFPDGLAAGPYAARRDGRLLLVPVTAEDGASPWRDGEHGDWIAALGWDEPRLAVVGGTAAVDEDVERRLELALFEGAGGGASSDGG